MREQAKPSPAWGARKLFERQLEQEGIKYKSDEDRYVVRIKYSSESFEEVSFVFLFDDDGCSASLSVYSIAELVRDRMADAWEFCNRMNAKYRWLRFFVDADCELTATADAAFTKESAAWVCRDLLLRAVKTVGAVCDELNG